MLLDLVDTTLRHDGYATKRGGVGADGTARTAVLFESEAVLGVATIFSSTSELLEKWEEVQTAFLRGNAARLRLDPSKAWSVYLVLLTQEPATDAGLARLARAGVTTSGDVQRALLPLLKVTAGATDAQHDPDAALRAKLTPDESSLFDFLRTGESEAALRWLLDANPPE
jgi:hypothetical protein